MGSAKLTFFVCSVKVQVFWRWPMPDQTQMEASSSLPLGPLSGWMESTVFLGECARGWECSTASKWWRPTHKIGQLMISKSSGQVYQINKILLTFQFVL